MAAKKGAGKKRRRWGWKVALALILLLALGLAGLYGASRVVHVRYATAWLRDLPPAFEGATILFVSDLDIRSEADARAAAGMMDALAALRPDVLLLGGDYASPGLWESVNGMDMENAAVAARAASDRYLFFSALSDFPAPLGKYAALAEEDALPEQLAQAMAVGGVRLLNGESVSLTRDGQALTLTGIGPDGDLSGLAAGVRGADCVVAFTHSPARFPAALTAEAADGGPWADMILAGGTHGGQMRVGERTLLPLDEQERRYISGWRKENGVFLLTSQGVGCEGVPLRLGTAAEVHLITLRRAAQAGAGANEA